MLSFASAELRQINGRVTFVVSRKESCSDQCDRPQPAMMFTRIGEELQEVEEAGRLAKWSEIRVNSAHRLGQCKLIHYVT